MFTIRILLSLVLTLPALAAADLQFTRSQPNPFVVYEPGSKVTYIFDLFNNGDATALLPTLTMPLPPGAHLIGVNTVVPTASCSESNSVVSCTALPVEPKKPGVIVFDVAAPTVGGAYPTVATLTSPSISGARTADALLNVYRDFVVTSTGDSGAGTLRQAILDSNAVCSDLATCRVRFALGAPQATIAPLTPLPAITSCRADFGIPATQQPLPLDTPRAIAISGAQLKEGDGLVVRSPCSNGGEVVIRGLAIHSFPWNGIDILGSAATTSIDQCFVGVDATGANERPNGLRGVASFATGMLRVTSSVISGNARSGVFVWSALSTSVGGSRLVHNGASGIFINSNVAFINANTIERNGDFGVAISKPAEFITVIDNHISENGVLGIDRGLDFRSIDDPLVPNPPTIVDAVYDSASNTTRITARWDPAPGQTARFGHFPRFYFFANTKLDGYGSPEAETPLLNTQLAPGAQTVSVPGDLRGKMITALVTVYRFGDDANPDTSEISAGVTVH